MVSEVTVKDMPSLAAIDAIIHKHNVQLGAVMPILQEIQGTYDYVPPAAIQRIAESIGVSASDIYGIVTFYSQFRLQPLGKNVIKVCHGTACHLNGAEHIAEVVVQATGAKEGETSQDDEFTVERVACLGCCSLAPCVMVNGETHGKLTIETAGRIVRQVCEETPATVGE